MADNNQQRKATSTMIRNIYSPDIALLQLKYYNTSISFEFRRFLSKDGTGKSTYDKAGVWTAIGWEPAYSIFALCHDICIGKEAAQGCLLTIPGAQNATLTLERKAAADGKMETWFSINKDNNIIQFKFQTRPYQVMENGQMVTKVREEGLGVFGDILHSYLTGTNSDRHLDKMTDDYVQSLGENAKPQQGGFQTNSGYQRNNNYPPRNNGGNYNRNGGGQYKKPWVPYNQQNQNQGPPPQRQTWENQAPPSQGMSNWTPPQ